MITKQPFDLSLRAMLSRRSERRDSAAKWEIKKNFAHSRRVLLGPHDRRGLDDEGRMGQAQSAPNPAPPTASWRQGRVNVYHLWILNDYCLFGDNGYFFLLRNVAFDDKRSIIIYILSLVPSPTLLWSLSSKGVSTSSVGTLAPCSLGVSALL